VGFRVVHESRRMVIPPTLGSRVKQEVDDIGARWKRTLEPVLPAFIPNWFKSRHVVLVPRPKEGEKVCRGNDSVEAVPVEEYVRFGHLCQSLPARSDMRAGRGKRRGPRHARFTSPLAPATGQPPICVY
jgi:hypothetical protein